MTTGKRAIKLSEANWPVRRSIRTVKQRISDRDEREMVNGWECLVTRGRHDWSEEEIRGATVTRKVKVCIACGLDWNEYLGKGC